MSFLSGDLVHMPSLHHLDQPGNRARFMLDTAIRDNKAQVGSQGCIDCNQLGSRETSRILLIKSGTGTRNLRSKIARFFTSLSQ